MKRFHLLSGALLLAATVATAQEKLPKVEVGVDYSWVHSTSPEDSRQVTSNGGSAYFDYNLNHVLGLVADFGGYHNGATHGEFGSQTTFTYLFGPRFNWRKSRFNPYVQFLFGGARLSGDTFLNGAARSLSPNGFATALGGGIDVAVTHHIAIKPIQVEYLMTEIANLATNNSSFQNDIRYSAGVVFRFGEK